MNPNLSSTRPIALLPLSDFGQSEPPPERSPVTDWYRGDWQGQQLSLPRTVGAEAIAQALMRQLGDRRQGEGKMYGVLLVQTARGDWGVLKAFSGLWAQQATVPGWVPPISGREQVTLVAQQTLAHLDVLKQELLDLQQHPAWAALTQAEQHVAQERVELTQQHRDRKHQRQVQRQQLLTQLTGVDLAAALERLDEQSRQDGGDRRRQKRHHDQILQPLREEVAALTAQRRSRQQQRKALSQALQAQMHQTYWLQNFAGQSLTLEALLPPGSIPTGTGDCCAPKLLHYAATQGLTPIALAEFWWGQPQGDKVPEQFYGACAERCQPLMGFLLSGLAAPHVSPGPSLDLAIVYADDDLIMVNKPAGLLSVPGRYAHTQDSVLSRLRSQHPAGDRLEAVHRLDQDTSGLLLLACHPASARALREQFQTRQVHKRYQAIVRGVDLPAQGQIDLPLWGDPRDRPRQGVDFQRGKPAQTQFWVLSQTMTQSRVELIPSTGRTHQLRVHAADPAGLNAPIWGDRLYGSAPRDPRVGDRLYLHAEQLTCRHPQSGQLLTGSVPTPF